MSTIRRAPMFWPCLSASAKASTAVMSALPKCVVAQPGLDAARRCADNAARALAFMEAQSSKLTSERVC